jgi:hypothetical protein
MKQKSSRIMRDGSKYAQEKYAFMLARGYEIVSVEEGFVGWNITLRKAELFVKIEHTRGDDFISFRTATQPPQEWTEIGSVVYAATGEMTSHAEDDNGKLQTYLDRIEAYFEHEFARDPDRLAAARTAYRATLPKVEPAVRKESKRIPILYYPLLAVVLLLLFGGLTTLYLLLLNGLFSTLSLETGPAGSFMAAGAILLAIGTLLVIRKWVRFLD